jgi:acyl-CoA synthetase (AMP-forming)/AMP-acid ligase II
MLGGITNRMFGRFDAGRVLDAIEGEGIEMFVGVPAMYRSMLDAGAEERDLTSVKVWASAADVMPRELAKKFQSMGRLAGPIPSLFMEAYGMVELAGAAMAKVSPPAVPMPKGFAGMPMFPYRVKVVDAKGNELPRGKVGELAVKGPGVLEGYHGDPESTGKVLQGGWLRTGDLARIGPLGTVFFEGRQKDVIKVGGYSVFPVEVEEEIRKHPKVADVAVLAIDDPVKGSVVGAAVVPSGGAKLSEADLDKWAKKELAAYRRPKRWLVVKEFPRGSTRKVDK